VDSELEVSVLLVVLFPPMGVPIVSDKDCAKAAPN
jgi:hypothetical protein